MATQRNRSASPITPSIRDENGKVPRSAWHELDPDHADKALAKLRTTMQDANKAAKKARLDYEQALIDALKACDDPTVKLPSEAVHVTSGDDAPCEVLWGHNFGKLSFALVETSERKSKPRSNVSDKPRL